MTTNDLRIGNYVNVPIQEQCPFRIDAFEYCSEKFIKVAQEVKLNGFEVHPLTWYGGDLQPIPLTEEWLLKFGFEKGSDKWMVKNDMAIFLDKRFKTNLILRDSQENNWCSFNIKVLYIHQLQNLYFALVGEELTFKSKDNDGK